MISRRGFVSGTIAGLTFPSMLFSTRKQPLTVEIARQRPERRDALVKQRVEELGLPTLNQGSYQDAVSYADFFPELAEVQEQIADKIRSSGNEIMQMVFSVAYPFYSLGTERRDMSGNFAYAVVPRRVDAQERFGAIVVSSFFDMTIEDFWRPYERSPPRLTSGEAYRFYDSFFQNAPREGFIMNTNIDLDSVLLHEAAHHSVLGEDSGSLEREFIMGHYDEVNEIVDNFLGGRINEFEAAGLISQSETRYVRELEVYNILDELSANEKAHIDYRDRNLELSPNCDAFSRFAYFMVYNDAVYQTTRMNSFLLERPPRTILAEAVANLRVVPELTEQGISLVYT